MSQDAVDELYESQAKTIDEALTLIKDVLRKELVENCAPEDDAIVTTTALLLL